MKTWIPLYLASIVLSGLMVGAVLWGESKKPVFVIDALASPDLPATSSSQEVSFPVERAK